MSPISPPSDSPPHSPPGGGVFNSEGELVASMRNLQIREMKMGCPSWGSQMGSRFNSPHEGSILRHGIGSLPLTPTRTPTKQGLGSIDLWEQACEEEPVMERVESKRNLRAIMYAKLSKDNSLGQVESAVSAPNVGWISELVK